MLIHARAPLRIGLAGGGTDVSPYCDEYGGFILNATISKYAYATIQTLTIKNVVFRARDINQEQIYPLNSFIPLDGRLNLHKAVYNFFVDHYNNGIPIAIEVNTFCEAPVGSGLGSSSTVVVAMIKAYVEYLNLPLDDYAMAKIAFKIERLDCGLQGGRQDQYSAVFGGFNFMEFHPQERVIINPLRIKNWILCELEASLVMYFTGVSRDSAAIISEQSNRIKSHSKATLEAMHGIKNEALMLKDSLLKGDFDGLVESLRKGWENKKKTSQLVSNPLINAIYDAACRSGALAGKVSGAGGGGFMWFFVPAEKRMDLIRTLSIFGGEIGNCRFTQEGAQAWKIQ